MYRFILLAVFAFCSAQSLYAQKFPGSVRGTLLDSASKQGLNDATVSVMGAKDSSLISFSLTSNSGFFEIKNLDTGVYILQVSYQGYPSIQKPFSLTAQAPVKDFGNIYADQEYKQLGEVVINSTPPIQVKGDTLAFRADAFKTKPNATVEDLLKKLPGVQVEKDGTVKTQGENVQKIYVDGKEFFGNDPKMATRNLTADMIENVEVFEEGSEQSRFSGVDDGNRTRAINLKLKKDKNKGVFGRAGAGYGTDNRYEANVNASYFKGATKLSLVSRSNNVNNQGFTQNDVTGINTGGSGPGITRNTMAGLNYSDLWGKKTEVTSSYFFNNTNTENNSSSFRRTFGGDSTVLRPQSVTSNNQGTNHRLNLRLTHSIDSFNSIVYTPNVSLQQSESYRSSEQQNLVENGKLTYKQLDNTTLQKNNGTGNSFNNNLLFRHRFAKRGRTFSINLSNSISNNDRNGSTFSNIGYYREGIKFRDSVVNQINIVDNKSNNYGASASYTEPIGRDKTLELNYQYNNNSSRNDRQVYDFNNGTGKFDVLNAFQTNLFENVNESNRVGANLRVVKKQYNYQFGLAAQRLTLNSNNLSRKTQLSQTFTNLFPSAQFNYRFARSKNFRFEYRGRTNQPSVTQLQPIRDVSSPLYQTEGNPSLRQEYSNNFTMQYNSFDMMKYRNLFARFTFSNTYNKIVNQVLQLDSGIQLSRPVNADGAFNMNGMINFGVPISKIKGGNINTTTTMNMFRNISYAGELKNYTNNLILGENVRVNYNYKEKFDIGFSGGVTYNLTRNTLNTRGNNEYYTYVTSADISYIFSQKWVLSTDLDYTTTTGLTQGYNQSFFLWNASFARQMLKNNRGELKLSVFDIMKQNRAISRNVADNYIEDIQNSVLQRYFMLTFTYNLNRMGNTQGNQRGGNQMMRMGGGNFGGGRGMQ
ncbi:outer membrane beta-barrel family protein [Paracnuella aquatica]|uniref:outer membrane beta-barrel family protein n=1 Tax=Paracnuella aquatica TaxID=2268757 RepID=UPI000DEEB8A2|nr:outer membrane beta-barrel family protein [Paracnuella aquatica]RPD50970.1 hypothetical protein DRJ53_05620 [Paracnuella aquatica]